MKLRTLLVLMLSVFLIAGCQSKPTESRPASVASPSISTETGTAPAVVVSTTVEPTKTASTVEATPTAKPEVKPKVEDQTFERDRIITTVRFFIEARGRGDYDSMKRVMSKKLQENWVEGDVRFHASTYNFKVDSISDTDAAVTLNYHVREVESSNKDVQTVDRWDSSELFLIKRNGRWEITTPSQVDCMVLLD